MLQLRRLCDRHQRGQPGRDDAGLRLRGPGERRLQRQQRRRRKHPQEVRQGSAGKQMQ